MIDHQNRVAVTRFSTDACAPRDRHEAWATRGWPTIGPLFDTVPAGSFHNRSERFALGAVSIHVADMAGQRYERDARLIRRGDFDQLMVSVTLGGEAHGDYGGMAVNCRPGQAVLTDLTMPNVHRSTDSHTILLTVPRLVAAEAGIEVRAMHGVTLSASRAALLRAHLLAIHQALPTLTNGPAARLGGTVVDLLAVAVESSAPGATALPEARETARMQAAKLAIEEQLGSTRLSVDWLCSRIAVSRSALYAMFEPHGGVQAYIRRRRLEQVRLALATPEGTSLASLAARWGFSDASHLSRAFRAQFGASPSEVRRQATEA